MKTLAPLHLKPSYWTATERAVLKIIREVIFEPLVEIIRSVNSRTEIMVASNALPDATLVKALRSGRVQYQNGVFSGEFSASISTALKRLGARFNERSRVWVADISKVPTWVKAEAAGYAIRASEAHALLNRKLSEILQHLDAAVDVRNVDADHTIKAFEDGFEARARQLAIEPVLTEESRKRLAAEYTDNLKLYVKKFSGEEIHKLREIVQGNANEGYRFDKLIPDLQKRYGISARKAKFLARQETAIYMSKYHEQRYREAGVGRYIWSTSHDAKVRPALGTHGTDNHRVLEGRIFEFSKPPIVDTATGRRKNPGQDYNCRCTPIPILDTQTDKAAADQYRADLAAA